MAVLGESPLIPPPDWILAIIRKPKGGNIYQPTTPAGTMTERERKYALVALDNIANELAATGTGSRNEALNIAALKMGHMIAAGWIGRATVEGRLQDASAANGLLTDDGQHGVNSTIKSGIEAGMKSPHSDLEKRERDNIAKARNTGEQNCPPVVPTGERSAVLVRADTLKPESISWAWPNRFAFGKMAMIAGDPGLGKSTILVDIAALHSTGGDFPCGEGKAVLSEVLFLTAEDGLRDTLVPRLMAAEADLTKIHFLTGTRAADAAADDSAMFDITKDVTVLRKVFTDKPAIKVLIIDPLTAYLGAGAKAKENTDVRRVLTPLVKLAEEFGVLLLANNHLNKNGGKALYRILDSIAFVALGRTIHLVATDAENPDNRKFICDKSNIGSKPLGLTYIIQKYWIKGEQGEEIETSRICWGTQHIDETADEALATEAGSNSATAKEEAVEFLRVVLAKGRVKIQDVEAEARAAGLLGKDQEISMSKPFRSARAELHVISTRDGFGPGAVYYWSLPNTTPPTILAPMVASSKDRATMDQEGKHGEKREGENRGETTDFVHTCPQAPYLPSQGMGKHEGNHGGPVAPDSIHNTEGEIVANGSLSAMPEDRREPGPGQLFARVTIKEITHPAIKAGPDDSLDDFVAF